LPGGRRREPRERSRKGRGLNAPQWDSARSDWLGSYGSCWLEVGAEGGFKLDLRQDPDPGKQKLKGAVRTETYQRHYCQHSSLFCLLRKGDVVFALASSSKQGRVSWQTMLGCWASWWCTPRLWKWRFPLPWSWWRSLVAIGLEPILWSLHGGYEPTILAFCRGWYPWRYNWLNFWLAITDVCVIQGRKLKNRRARTQALGWALARKPLWNVVP
jgi:hypothetical protein